METPDPSTLLHVWERGASRSAAVRGLLLLAAALPGTPTPTLAKLSIGRRDAALLDLRERVFGSQLDCIMTCEQCGEQIALEFPVDRIRAPSPQGETTFRVEIDGYDVQFRLPHSEDLMALGHETEGDRAEQQLLARCVLEASALPAGVVAAVDRRMGELDPQAEVLLDMTCPACEQPHRALFDIVTHLWSEIDVWARSFMRDIHSIAVAYGWSESQILALSGARRRAYLDLIGVC